jgi:hypothetical protein
MADFVASARMSAATFYSARMTFCVLSAASRNPHLPRSAAAPVWSRPCEPPAQKANRPRR